MPFSPYYLTRDSYFYQIQKYTNEFRIHSSTFFKGIYSFWLCFICVQSLCLPMCLYVHLHVQECVWMCPWKPEINAGDLSQSFSILFIEQNFSLTLEPVSSGLLLPVPPGTGVTNGPCQAWISYLGLGSHPWAFSS